MGIRQDAPAPPSGDEGGREVGAHDVFILPNGSGRLGGGEEARVRGGGLLVAPEAVEDLGAEVLGALAFSLAAAALI